MLRRGRYTLALLTLGALFVVGCGDAEVGPQGPPGSNGMPGEPGLNDPAINAITPRKVFLDRQVTVTIGGNDTAWSDMATVDFGAGITSKIVSISPAFIVADLTIDETAALGPRDVIVTNGTADSPLTLKGAFEVAAPLAITQLQGTLAQGSIYVARMRQLDVTTPLDPSSGGKNVSMSSAAGLGMTIEEVQDYTLDFTGYVDVDTAAGDFDYRVVSGRPGEEIASLAPKAAKVTARTPMPLVEGTQTAGSVATPFESYLYSFAPGPHKLVNIDTSAMDPNALAGFVLLPESGKFADLVSFGASGRLLTVTDQPIYMVYWDASGASGYPFDFNIATEASDDLEPNDTCATAQALNVATPAALKNLSLRSNADEDWFVITAAAGDVGKVVHATTKPGDTKTDTFVEVFSGTCANLVPLGAASADQGYHEDHSSANIAGAGKVFLKVSNSPSSSHKGSYYDLDVKLEKSEQEPNNACAQANAITSLPLDLGFASLAAADDVDWYAVTVTAADVGKLLEISTTPGDENTDTYIEVYSGACGSPMLLGTSKDSEFHESLQVGPIAAPGVYRVRVSNSPTYPYGGSKYDIHFSTVDAPDQEPNNTCAQAQQGPALGMTLGPLTLPSQTDEDWFVFPISAADVGKSVHVVTAPGDSNTDTLVEVFEGACGSPVSLGGPSTDLFYHEDWLSSPVTQPGVVYVKVSYSPASYVDDAYTLTVDLQ